MFFTFHNLRKYDGPLFILLLRQQLLHHFELNHQFQTDYDKQLSVFYKLFFNPTSPVSAFH